MLDLAHVKLRRQRLVQGLLLSPVTPNMITDISVPRTNILPWNA